MVVTTHKPDFAHFRRTVLRQGPPGPIPWIELKVDDPIMEHFVGKLPTATDRQSRAQRLDLVLQFYREFGYDFVNVKIGIPLKRFGLRTGDTAPGGGTREWVNEHSGAITSWADWEKFRWPTPDEIDYWDIEYAAQHLPEGMQIIPRSSGILEWVTWLMGYETFALALTDYPDLVEAIFEKVGGLVTAACEHVSQMPGVGAFWLGDDMGFATSTLISPKHLRQYVFPRQRRLAEILHRRDLPFLMHTCGNLATIMDELIDYVGIDAKQSFEDKHTPVEEAMRRWGDRVSILGGLDMDLLGRGSEEQVRKRTRQILEFCAPRPGYCLGTGNSVANYLPVPNYLAMLDEGKRWNLEHFGTV